MFFYLLCRGRAHTFKPVNDSSVFTAYVFFYQLSRLRDSQGLESLVDVICKGSFSLWSQSCIKRLSARAHCSS